MGAPASIGVDGVPPSVETTAAQRPSTQRSPPPQSLTVSQGVSPSPVAWGQPEAGAIDAKTIAARKKDEGWR
jgi:hypothetical protein